MRGTTRDETAARDVRMKSGERCVWSGDEERLNGGGNWDTGDGRSNLTQKKKGYLKKTVARKSDMTHTVHRLRRTRHAKWLDGGYRRIRDVMWVDAGRCWCADRWLHRQAKPLVGEGAGGKAGWRRHQQLLVRLSVDCEYGVLLRVCHPISWAASIGIGLSLLTDFYL